VEEVDVDNLQLGHIFEQPRVVVQELSRSNGLFGLSDRTEFSHRCNFLRCVRSFAREPLSHDYIRVMEVALVDAIEVHVEVGQGDSLCTFNATRFKLARCLELLSILPESLKLDLFESTDDIDDSTKH